jgi:uracil-DNA glycosylase
VEDERVDNVEVDLILTRVRQTAESAPMSFDREVYQKAGRDPFDPILFAGSLDAPVAFFARDLGRDEVLLGQPLIGGAGRRVRRAVYRFLFGVEPPGGDRFLSQALEQILLTNTVPYKPVGNKAYPATVRERFRPWAADLLCCCWKGEYVVTLGTEAFLWFARYGGPGALEEFWKRGDRYESEIAVEITAECEGSPCTKMVKIAPLPHPSPLNRAYLEVFPELLESRLKSSPLNRLRGAKQE